MRWIKIEDKRPPENEWIWIWDCIQQKKILDFYDGSEDEWISGKYDKNFPIWAHLNDSYLREWI